MRVGTIFTLKKDPKELLHFNYLNKSSDGVYYFDVNKGRFMAIPCEYEVVDIGDDEALRQQILTQDFLQLIDESLPSWKPLVSGGAPRDWDVGTPANDIDVWCTNAPLSGDDVKTQLERLVGERGVVAQISPQNYATGEGYIEYIYSVTICGLEFQFIFVTDNSVQAVHNHVCASLSRIHFDHNTLMLHPTSDYKSSRKQQCITYYDDKGCSPRVSYVSKMKERYPEYTHNFDNLHDRSLARTLEDLWFPTSTLR